MKVHFAYLTKSKITFNSLLVREWIKKIIEEENKKLGKIYFIFTSNKHILEINRKFLKHSYFTDVISFGENFKEFVGGEVFISIDQVKANAKIFRTDEKNELQRVMVHGVLHLLGYEDESDLKRAHMSEKEDYYLKMGKEKYNL